MFIVPNNISMKINNNVPNSANVSTQIIILVTNKLFYDLPFIIIRYPRMSPANNCVTSWENRIFDRNTNDTVRRIDFTKNRFYNFPMQAYYILFPKIMYSKITSIYYESSSHLKPEWPSLIHIAITRDLTRETWSFCFEVGGIFIIYRGDFRIHYFRKQNIISLHGEIV